MNHVATKDYLAYCNMGMGGSWARDDNPEKAIKRCGKITYSDWKHLYKLKGETATIGLFDVTGHDHVYMDAGVVWVEDGEGKKTYIRPARVEEVKLG